MITLKNVLRVNALSSGVTGLLLVIMPKAVSDLFAAGQSWPFIATGVFLMLFALLVFYAASMQKTHPSLVRFIVFLDSLWVTASLVTVALNLFSLSLWGYMLITGVAVWVGLMVLLQLNGLRKYMAASAQ